MPAPRTNCPECGRPMTSKRNTESIWLECGYSDCGMRGLPHNVQPRRKKRGKDKR